MNDNKILFGYSNFNEEQLYQEYPNGFSSEGYNKNPNMKVNSENKHCDNIIGVKKNKWVDNELYFMYKNVNNIKKGEKYIYPIEAYYIEIDKNGNYCYIIPEKVVDDIKNNQCVILFERLWEGDGTIYRTNLSFKNRFEPDQLGKILHNTYKDISYSSIFFMNADLNIKNRKSVHPIFGFNFCETVNNETSLEDISRIKYDILSKKIRDYKFCCLNRRDREHRIYLAYLLFDLIHNNDLIYTFSVFDNNTLTYIKETLERKYGINDEKQILKMTNSLPWVYDISDNNIIDTTTNCDIYESSYINLVTETYFGEHNTAFFTEKICKPIRKMQPFILVSTPHSLKKLREIGYETFPEIIDESYDDIEDDKERLEAIAKEVRRLYSKSKEELHNMVVSVIDKLEHNVNLSRNRKINSAKNFYDTLKKEIYGNWPKTLQLLY